MAAECGGYADKFGNRYEANWVAYQLIRLLEEKIISVVVEPLGPDGQGVDILINNIDGTTEYHQCKKSNGNNESWALAQLCSSKILSNAWFQIERNNEFYLVSPLSCKIISDLSDSALNSNGNPEDFLKWQINASKERKKIFEKLCNYLNLDITCLKDVSRAINFLQKFKIEQFNDTKTSEELLQSRISLLYSDDAANILRFLKIYPVDKDKLRNQITPFLLQGDLEKSGFNRRVMPSDTRIKTAIDNLSEEFNNSICSSPVANLINRKNEVQQLSDSIQSNAVTLLTAEAGYGKSFLLLQLHEYLQQQKIISVPIRLDRRIPATNLEQYGISLGFLASPVYCLSKYATAQKVVFILDQLDAIRWTAMHSSQALEICRQFIEQIIYLRKENKNISVVLAARTFDINEDVALSSWIKSLDNECRKINLAELDENTVNDLVSPYENYSDLLSEKKRILRIPLWLGFYLSIASNNHNSVTKLNNKLELIQEFIKDRMQEVERCSVSSSEAHALADSISQLMMKSCRLTVSESLLPVEMPKQLKALISVGLLNRQNGQISFRHQVLFDYQIGFSLYQTAMLSVENLLDAIGSREEQTLMKREQLKYAMNLLLQTNQESFCNCVNAILFTDDIRFHLKHLVLYCIKDIQELKKPARKLIDKIITEPDFTIQFLQNASFGNSYIVGYLIDAGYIAGWLQNTDQVLVNSTINLLFSVVNIIPELVVKEITPLVGLSDSLDAKIFRALPIGMENDADILFDLRKKIIKLFKWPYSINWKNLATKYPQRALDLISITLDQHQQELSGESMIDPFMSECYWPEYNDNVIQMAEVIPQVVLKFFLTYIDNIFTVNSKKSNVEQWFKSFRWGSNEKISIQETILKMIKIAGGQLQDRPEELIKLIKPYLNHPNLIFIHIIANQLFYLPVKYADMVISWLLKEPQQRLSCGNTWVESEWALAEKLIEKFSPHCSEELFKQLEHTIYCIPPLKGIEYIKSQLAKRKNGIFEHYWGHAQYFLLPKLDHQRLKPDTCELIAVLQRKFGFYKNVGNIANHGGGWVTSPLPEGNCLSDKNWRQLILAPEAKLNSNKWKQINENTLVKSEIENFARSFETNVRNQPSRFARFALTLPVSIHKEFIEALFSGLAETDRNKIAKDFQAEWQPCPVELLEKIILHFYNHVSELSLVSMLANRKYDISKSLIDMLSNLAKFSPDPKPNTLSVYTSGQNKCADSVNIEELYNNSFNCVRGNAYHALAKIFRKNKEFALANLDIIQAAINDEHPAVQITSTALLLSILNYNKDYAHKNFLALCQKNIIFSCSPEANDFFNSGFGGPHEYLYIELVLNMLNSDKSEVRMLAAKQIYARWFFDNLFTDELPQVLNGDNVLKNGCTDFIIQILVNDKYTDKIEKIEFAYKRLLNDENIEIVKKLGRCITSEDYWTKSNFQKLFSNFVNSRAAIYCINELCWTINNYPGKLTDLCSLLLILVENINRRYQSEDIWDSWQDESNLIPAIQRIYDEAIEDEDKETMNICLDICDELFKLRPYTALKITKSLDNDVLV